MQQPMPNPEDITDPTNAINMALILMAKAFKLNYSTPTNNNQRFSSSPRNRQIAQPGMNLGKDRQMQMVGGNGGNHIRQYIGQNVGNHNRYNVVQNVRNQNANQNVNGNVVAARAEGHGNLDEIGKVNSKCILMANLQQASTSSTQTDKALVYDSNGSAEVYHSENCYDNDILNMFTQEEHVEKSRGIVKQHPATIKKTRSYFESLYNNLAIKVEKVNSVNRNLKATNADLTTELVRYKNQEKCFEINQEKYDKLERCYQKSAYQEKCLTKMINALHLSAAKTITTLNEEITNLNNQLSKEKSTVPYLQQEKKKLKSDFKIREDALLDKQIQLENKIKELDNSLVQNK
ncbi:hypothetical protein Tco_1309989 [Tanacetum coccineum]